MPANIYHVYNRAVEHRSLFNDDEDYEVFLGYLKGYVTPPIGREEAKRVFVVNGQTFRGTPHQPKNYSGKVEIIAYNLMPDHFHLILRQLSEAAVEGFIRSLSTRYSIYFNKKYKRSGSLFRGPYKSIHIQDDHTITLLTSYLHHQSAKHSSYPEYTGARETPWVKNVANVPTKFEPDEHQVTLLRQITFETLEEHIEAENVKPVQSAQPVLPVAPEVKLPEPQIKAVNKRKPRRYAEFFMAVLGFFVLTNIGINNIAKAAVPSVLSATTEMPAPSAIPLPTFSPLPTATLKPITYVTVNLPNASESANVYKEESITSDVVQQVNNAEVLQSVSFNESWYRVLLSDGTGYIETKYIQLGGSDR